MFYKFLKFQNFKIALWKIRKFKPHLFIMRSYVQLYMDSNINHTMNLGVVVFQFKDRIFLHPNIRHSTPVILRSLTGHLIRSVFIVGSYILQNTGSQKHRFNWSNKHF